MTIVVNALEVRATCGELGHRRGRSGGGSGGVYGDAHAEVDGDGGVGEGADGDEVGASEGVLADVLEGDAAGGLDGNGGESGFDLLDGLLDGGGRHVVEQDGFGSAGDGGVELGLRADFDLHGLLAFAEFERVGEGRGDAAAKRRRGCS